MASQADTEPMDYGGDHEFSASQRAFVVEHKLAGRKYPSISRRFQEKYGIEAPTRRHVYNLVKKLKTKYTLLDQRKGKKGRPNTVVNARNIDRVRRGLERAAVREPGVQGDTARRNRFGIDKSSFNRITKKHLKLHPFFPIFSISRVVSKVASSCC